MSLLLRLLERRVAYGVAAVLLALWAATRYTDTALGRLDIALHPPAPTTSPLSAAITKDVEARESARLRGLHRAVSAEIAAAAGRNFDADRFQRLADGALKLDTPAYRSAAVERLNKLRLAIPQKHETFRPASAEDLNPDLFESPRPKGKAARR